MADNVLELDHVSVEIGGRKLVDDVTLNLPSGQLVAMIGPNGAGKTTLLRAIVGVIRYTGSIKVNGQYGYVPQRLQYDRSLPMTVAEFLALNLQTSPIALGTKSSNRKAIELLDEVGARKLARFSLGGLSGGELQRVMLASALHHKPNLLLLDEPAAGVDISGEATFNDLIEKLVRERGVTVVMVSHDLSLVSDMTDHVVCLNKTLACEGSAKDLLTAERIAEVFGGHKAVYGHHHHH